MYGLMANGYGTADGFGLAVIGVCRHIPMQSGSEAIGTEDLTAGMERVGIGGNFICRTDFNVCSHQKGGNEV